ncbi:hypothetical protein [Phreatobacter sp.]|uniref:hypothetical protein n=1 Tax=Phreatobacter sp. TaxID=1966341 RepID=UPI0025E87593|nr:hypothetical protein [Phreatobacter sp.]
MKKIILAAALLAPLAAAPASAQVEATEANSVTQYQTQAPREFTARRATYAPITADRSDVQSDRQGLSGNF